jgi:hypothetical protein
VAVASTSGAWESIDAPVHAEWFEPVNEKLFTTIHLQSFKMMRRRTTLVESFWKQAELPF